MGAPRVIEEDVILHVIDALVPGGAERVLVELVNGLHRKGLRVGVCVTRTGTDLADELSPDIPIVVLGRTHRWDLGGVRKFIAFCREHGVSIIHAHGRSSASFVALAVLFLPRRTRFVMHDHNGRDSQVPPLLGAISRHLCHAYICVSDGLYSWALAHLKLPPEKCLILANAIDLERFEPKAMFAPSNPLRGVLVANLRPEKNHRLVLDAVASSALLRERLHLSFVGNGVESPTGQSLQTQRDALGLESCIAIVGGRRRIEHVLRDADFGLVASRVEAGPVVTLEYMAAGIPFLTTRTGQVAEIVEGKGVCLVVPPGDVVAMREGLEAMVNTEPAERAAMGQRGRALLEELFGLEVQLDRLMALYARIVPAGLPARVDRTASTAAGALA